MSNDIHAQKETGKLWAWFTICVCVFFVVMGVIVSFSTPLLWGWGSYGQLSMAVRVLMMIASLLMVFTTAVNFYRGTFASRRTVAILGVGALIVAANCIFTF